MIFKKFIPTYYAKNIYEVPMEFFKKNNIRIIFTDLDNTLDSYKCLLATSKAIKLKTTLEENGIKLIIISNNHEERVKKYADSLGVSYLSTSLKPFGKKINDYIKENGFNKDEILMVGDQFITDIQAAKNVDVRSMITDKLVKEDQWTTHFNRIPDTIIRKYFKKKKVLQEREAKL